MSSKLKDTLGKQYETVADTQIGQAVTMIWPHHMKTLMGPKFADTFLAVLRSNYHVLKIKGHSSIKSKVIHRSKA
jgi:hypothetical protein